METRVRKNAKSMDDGGDRISGLPDELLHHVMSFLSARDAVRTCVLSLRWHHLWATARCLNIDANSFTGQEKFIEFVTALLLSRGSTPLHSVWIRANQPGIFLDRFCATANLWIRHSLRSNVQELGIIGYDLDDTDEYMPFTLDFCIMTSLYLKKLHLYNIYIGNCHMEKLFSGCQALEELEMVSCKFDGTEFSSATLKKLSIVCVRFTVLEDYDRYVDATLIKMPSLVSLHIKSVQCPKPILVGAQSLVTASISLDRSSYCGITFADACDILGTLSNVKNLELLFSCDLLGECSLQSDMRLCQVMFTNLTTLSLSDWCLHDNCKALLYMLEHSPNLEKLTLMLRKWFLKGYDMEAPCEETTTPFSCEKLKKVEIICPNGDKRVSMLVTILYASIISPPEINIKPFRPVMGLPFIWSWS